MTIQHTTFNSHKVHNPNCDIMEGRIDQNTFITYCIYVKGNLKGQESMEYYSGPNYNRSSVGQVNSYSKHYSADKIPKKWRPLWEDLKSRYQKMLKPVYK